jgi:hypothetical protein
MGVLKIRNNADDGWIVLGGVGTVYESTSAPATPHAGQLWLDTDAVLDKLSYVSDLDNDTLVQCEESSDEDTIRFDCGGTGNVLVLTDSAISGTLVADEDDMASNSSNFICTQKSIKTYVDTEISAGGGGLGFSAGQTAQINLPGAGATTQLRFGTEIWDEDADYNNSTWVFTAPATGRYQCNILVSYDAVEYFMSYCYISVVTSNRTYVFNYDWHSIYNYPNKAASAFSLVVDMDAADTVYLSFYQLSGTSVQDTNANGRWSMYLLV